ncbi:MAG: stage 0 sporulation family protein [Eubacteriales bacterium]|nr:stage 0 sporulation family protein [Eubacteriales bacterium]MDD3199445.1 stage 0 sporulation family protein [Eubacteriales bacterium]MDD4629692.1 stage 0 sporulation family protein [Eubacteriales bacterium]
MVTVAGVRFKKAGKIYYFDPADLQIEKGISVIVETARGMEFGTVTSGIKDVPEKEIVAPLKKIVRIADENDIIQNKENIVKKQRSLELCQEKINKHNLQMKLIDVEYTFDNSKIIFYFTADGRVDFRELVKDLAAVFKMRIELRQIGVRDEAKMVGGIGTCGKGLCCHTWLSEFEPVSIKMAKVQNLSLNPTKISGICGRLMCCLKYENEIYYELRKGMPDIGERIKTEDGIGIVYDTNILENKVKVRLILEEKTTDKPEKLSTDFYTYKKQQINRIDVKESRDVLDDIDEALLDEIKDLLKE